MPCERRSTRAFLPRAGLRSGTQSRAAFPKEYPGRRPPPSTLCSCPAWVFRLASPFFCRSETAVEKGLAPAESLALVQFCQECAPNAEPSPVLFPIAKSALAGRWCREFPGQILPASAVRRVHKIPSSTLRSSAAGRPPRRSTVIHPTLSNEKPMIEGLYRGGKDPRRVEPIPVG